MIQPSSPLTWSVWVALVALALLVCPRQAPAQTLTRVCDPEDPQSCSQPLQEGDRAPYAGQLLTPRLALKLGQLADRCAAELELQQGYLTKLAAIEKELGEARAKIESETRVQERDFLLGELAKREQTPWYERPAFVTLASVVLTGGLLSLVYFAAR